MVAQQKIPRKDAQVPKTGTSLCHKTLAVLQKLCWTHWGTCNGPLRKDGHPLSQGPELNLADLEGCGGQSLRQTSQWDVSSGLVQAGTSDHSHPPVLLNGKEG